jgi:hypothetical protein
VSWDIIARALFVDSGLAKGVAETNAKIHDLAKAAPGGARGLNLVETSMRSLAFEAVGIQGPLGRIAEGLLKFGGGSTLVLGVTAGIGLIAAVYKDFTAEARAAEKAQTDFIESLKKTPQGAALVGRNALKEAQDKLRSLTAPGATGPGGAMIPPAMIEQARMEVAQLQNALVPLQNAAAETARRRTEEIDRQNEALAAQALAMRDLVSGQCRARAGARILSRHHARAGRPDPQLPALPSHHRGCRRSQHGTARQPNQHATDRGQHGA